MGLIKGVVKLFELIYNEANNEFLDETPYIQALDELYIMLENGDISEEKYDQEEEQIIKRLKYIRKLKKKQKEERR